MKVEAVYKKRKELSDFLPASERHKLKVIKNPSVNSPARSVVLPSNDNSLTEAPAGGPHQQQPPAAAPPPEVNKPEAGNQLTGNTAGLTGKRRPSEPDLTEADSGMSCDSSRMNCDVEMTQPPVKRANTVTSDNTNSADGFTENSNVNNKQLTTTTPPEVETMNCDVEMTTTQHPTATISRKNNVTVTSSSASKSADTTSASITNGNGNTAGLEVS